MPLTTQRDDDALRAGLARWLGRPVIDIARPAPGWSCETLIVDGTLVVRLPPSGDGIFPTYDLELQAAVQQAVGDAGVPVAHPARYEPDPTFLGAPFVAMPFVDGPIPANFTPVDEWLAGLPDDSSRRHVWETFVDAVLAVHGVEAREIALRAGLDAELAYWSEYVGWACDGAPPAGLAEAVAWCVANRPAAEPEGGLLWGDVRLGNVVFDGARRAPKALLDWDMASRGALEMDVAWFTALESVQTDVSGMTVPGFGSRDDLVARVERRAGRALVDLDWYEVFALVRASAISTRIAILFERAGQPTMFKIGADPTLTAALARISP